jgi:hypothetical protein
VRGWLIMALAKSTKILQICWVRPLANRCYLGLVSRHFISRNDVTKVSNFRLCKCALL